MLAIAGQTAGPNGRIFFEGKFNFFPPRATPEISSSLSY